MQSVRKFSGGWCGQRCRHRHWLRHWLQGFRIAFRIEVGDARVVYRGVESVYAVRRADMGINSGTGTGQGRRVESVSAVEVHVAQSGESDVSQRRYSGPCGH